MKTRNKILTVLSILTILITTVARTPYVHAETISGTESTGYNHTGQAIGSNGATAQYNNQAIEELFMNGEVNFCVEPSRFLNEFGNYTPNAYDNEQLSKIVYHAYWTTSRSKLDYAITQLMIWEYLGYIPDSHTVPNYETRKDEVNALIVKHDIVSSFNNQNVVLNKGESITLTDTNNVLSQLSFASNSSGIEYSITGNQLSLTASNNAQSGSLVFQKYNDANVIGASIIYTNPNSQAIALIKLGNPVNMSVNIQIASGGIELLKTGNTFTKVEKTQLGKGLELVKPLFEESHLAGAEFTIRAKNDYVDHSGNIIKAAGEIIAVITSDNDGIARFDGLGEGTFSYQETKAPLGYNIDTNVYDFTITADGGSDQLQKVTIKNDAKPQMYAFNKTLEANPIEGLHNKNAYKNVEFAIFTAESIANYNNSVIIPADSMVSKFGIDDQGRMVTKFTDGNGKEVMVPFNQNLPYGNYYIKEIATDDSYILDATKYPFTLDATTDQRDILVQVNNGNEIMNKLKTYTVVVQKVDSVTKNRVTGLDFKFEARMYDKQGKVVYQEIVNANPSDGSVTFTIKGQVDKVEIREVEAPNGYILSSEVKTFAINNKTEKTLFDNNRVYAFMYENEMNLIVQTSDNTNTMFLVIMMTLSLFVMSFVIFMKLRMN